MSAAIPIVMPRLGMTMEEGTVNEWPAALGREIARGEVVLVIESEKTEVEIEATATGFLRHIYVQPGETVPCGTLLALLTASADEPFDADEVLAAHEHAAGPRAKEPNTVSGSPPPRPATPGSGPERRQRRPVCQRVPKCRARPNRSNDERLDF